MSPIHGQDISLGIYGSACKSVVIQGGGIESYCQRGCVRMRGWIPIDDLGEVQCSRNINQASSATCSGTTIWRTGLHFIIIFPKVRTENLPKMVVFCIYIWTNSGILFIYAAFLTYPLFGSDGFSITRLQGEALAAYHSRDWLST